MCVYVYVYVSSCSVGRYFLGLGTLSGHCRCYYLELNFDVLVVTEVVLVFTTTSIGVVFRTLKRFAKKVMLGVALVFMYLCLCAQKAHAVG